MIVTDSLRVKMEKSRRVRGRVWCAIIVAATARANAFASEQQRRTLEGTEAPDSLASYLREASQTDHVASTTTYTSTTRHATQNVSSSAATSAPLNYTTPQSPPQLPKPATEAVATTHAGDGSSNALSSVSALNTQTNSAEHSLLVNHDHGSELEASVLKLVANLNKASQGFASTASTSSTGNGVGSNHSTLGSSSWQEASLQTNDGHAILGLRDHLQNISLALASLKMSMNRTEETAVKARAEAASANEELSVVAMERESEEIIDKIERGVYVIDYVSGRLRSRKTGEDVVMPKGLFKMLLASTPASSPASSPSSPSSSAASKGVNIPPASPLSKASKSLTLESALDSFKALVQGPSSKTTTGSEEDSAPKPPEAPAPAPAPAPPAKSSEKVPAEPNSPTTPPPEPASLPGASGSSPPADTAPALAVALATVFQTAILPAAAAKTEPRSTALLSKASKAPIQTSQSLSQGAAATTPAVAALRQSAAAAATLATASATSTTEAVGLEAAEEESSSLLLNLVSRKPTSMPTVPRSTRGQCVSANRKCLVRHGVVVNTACWASAACEEWQSENTAAPSSSVSPGLSASSSLSSFSSPDLARSSNAHTVPGDKPLTSTITGTANGTTSAKSSSAAGGLGNGVDTNTQGGESVTSEAATTASLGSSPSSSEPLPGTEHSTAPSLGERDAAEISEDHSDASNVVEPDISSTDGASGADSTDSASGADSTDSASGADSTDSASGADSSGSSSDNNTPMLRGSAAVVLPQSPLPEPLYQPPPPPVGPALAQLPLHDSAPNQISLGTGGLSVEAAAVDDNAAMREAAANEAAKNLDDEVNAMSEEDAALQLEKERTARLAAIVSKLKEATEAADPSSLKTNLRMLQDIMVAFSAAAVGGLAAALLGLPTNLGYLAGGYAVGPSSPLAVLRTSLMHADVVHTLASLGPSFVLFRRGMEYSSLRHAASKSYYGRTSSSSNLGSPGGLASGGGASIGLGGSSGGGSSGGGSGISASLGINWCGSSSSGDLSEAWWWVSFFGLVYIVAAAASYQAGWTHSISEAMLLAAAVTLSDTARVLNSLDRSATRHVAVGQALVGLMSAQDLFLAFVFAVPTALHNSFLKTGGGHPWLKTLIFDIAAVWAAVLVSRHVIPRLLRRLFMPQDQSPSSSSASSNCAQSSQFAPSSPYSGSSPSGEKHRNLQYEIASHGNKKKNQGGLGAKAGNTIEGGARKSQPLLDSFDAVAAMEVASSHCHDDNDSHHPNKSSSHLSHTGDGKDSSENSGDDDDNERPLSPERTLLLDTMASSSDAASSSSSSSTSGFGRRGSSGPHNSSSSSSGVNVSGSHKQNNNSGKSRDNGSSSSSSGSASRTLRAPPELLTLLVVVYCLSMALLSEYMSLSYSSGALVAGLLWQGNLPDGLGLQAHAASEAVVQTLASCFGGLYLASLGMTVSPVFIWAHAGRVTTFVVATFLGKTLIGAGTLKRFYGFPWPVAIAAGSTTGHIGTVALFFVGRARRLGLFSRELHLITLSAAFVHMALQPLPAALLADLPANVLRNHNTTKLSAPGSSSSSSGGGSIGGSTTGGSGSSGSTASGGSSSSSSAKGCGKCICHVLPFCPCCLLFAHTEKRQEETV